MVPTTVSGGTNTWNQYLRWREQRQPRWLIQLHSWKSLVLGRGRATFSSARDLEVHTLVCCFQSARGVYLISFTILYAWVDAGLMFHVPFPLCLTPILCRPLLSSVTSRKQHLKLFWYRGFDLPPFLSLLTPYTHTSNASALCAPIHISLLLGNM